jgi:hypothetical protein
MISESFYAHKGDVAIVHNIKNNTNRSSLVLSLRAYKYSQYWLKRT